MELFWKDFNNNVSKVKEKRTREVLDLLNESLGDLIFDKDNEGNVVRKCQLCGSGTLSLKNSFRGGAFIGCSNYPECKFTRPLSKAKAAAQAQKAQSSPPTGNTIPTFSAETMVSSAKIRTLGITV